MGNYFGKYPNMSMALDLNKLINGNDSIESSRLEFKTGWNPFSIIRTVCAFTNDISGKGGGYIIIGIEEKDGIPQLPPVGVDKKEADKIQKEFFKLCQDNLRESVFPDIDAVQFQNKWVIVITVTAGEERPYYASDGPGKNSKLAIYVRQGTVTKEASKEEERQLRELGSNKNYDDKINQRSSLNDLDLGLILSYLQEKGSGLFNDAPKIPFPELCLKLGIARGPIDNVKPINVGLLLFCKQPEKFFPGCRTIIVSFKDEYGSDPEFSKEFSGPVQNQIRDLLSFFNTNIIKEHITKLELEAKSQAFYNYPFQALEEAIVNSLYHRSFENDEPNLIRIYTVGANRRIEIISYPGPVAPIDQDTLMQDRVPPKHRNIKLGDWLKTLNLTEKFGSGIQTIRKSMAENGSEKPQLITDIEKTHFLAVLKIHPDWPQETALSSSVPSAILSNEQQLVLEKCKESPSRSELFTAFKGKISKQDLKIIIDFLVNQKYILEKTSNLFFGVYKIRAYFITSSGQDILKRSF